MCIRDSWSSGRATSSGRTTRPAISTLESFSEAINHGVNGTCETTDARSAARVGVCDSGAFEYGGVAP